MGYWDIDIVNKTATSENGIIFKMTRNAHGDYCGECLNPEAIPPDDVDDAILARMVREAGMFYYEALRWEKR